MDNLTHSLTGLALARAGFGKLAGPRGEGTLLMILAANAPDSDIVTLFGGTQHYFESHRGYTHCLLALPAMAALCVLATSLIYRRRLPFWRSLLAASVGVGSHLLLDWTNSYGIRLALPFSSRWFHGDLNSLTDLVMLTLLLLAAVWPYFARLVSGEMGSRQKQSGRASAIAVLCAYLFFDIARSMLQGRAIEHFSGRAINGESIQSIAALPWSGNPFAWTMVLAAPSAFQLRNFNVLQPDNETGQPVFRLPDNHDAMQAAATTEPFRFFRYFARFPVWSVQPVTVHGQSRTRVELTDLRFGTPGSGSFHCVALLDERGQVVTSHFGYSLAAANEGAK